MGRIVREQISDSDHEFVFGIDVNDRGEEIYTIEKFEELMNSKQVDVVIDFSSPESAVQAADKCASNNVPYVTGTSGLSEKQLEEMKSLARESPILRASNFAPGIQALRKAVLEVVSSLPGYDIELTETHHNRKEDAPSGTAKTIIRDIEKEVGERDQQHGREGIVPRSEDEIGVHARRAGDIKGEHEVLLAGNDEVLKISHRSESRAVFAAGAIKAAEWIKNQDPGFYSFEDVL